MPNLDPRLTAEIKQLGDTIKIQFSQPEFIPGCEVVDITDINFYSSNNGWIEAICGQHNQQRVRWKSSDSVFVGSYADVLYFPGRKVFEFYGLSGEGAILERYSRIFQHMGA